MSDAPHIHDGIRVYVKAVEAGMYTEVQARFVRFANPALPVANLTQTATATANGAPHRHQVLHDKCVR